MLVLGILTAKRYDVRDGVLWIHPVGLNRLFWASKRVSLEGACVVCRFQDGLLRVIDREELEYTIALPSLGGRHRLVGAVLSNARDS